jgi:hypothetical protein
MIIRCAFDCVLPVRHQVSAHTSGVRSPSTEGWVRTGLLSTEPLNMVSILNERQRKQLKQHVNFDYTALNNGVDFKSIASRGDRFTVCTNS